MVHSTSGELGLTFDQSVVGQEELQAHVRVVSAAIDETPAKRSLKHNRYIKLLLQPTIFTVFCLEKYKNSADAIFTVSHLI